MRKTIIIEPNSNHFDYLAKEIKKYYNPYSFLFIGPTGHYVRQVSDKFAVLLGKTINKDSFMVINQYVTEKLLKNNMDAVYFDRDFLKAFIAEKVEELLKAQEKNKDSYYDFLRVVSRSKGIIDYILDLFEKAWELNNSENIQIPTYYKEIETILNQDGNLPKLLKELLREIALFFQKTENIFDPITTYKWYIENADFFENQKETLVISGFFDLTPLVRKTLQKLFEKSQNVYFYVWQKISDRAFKEIDEVYKFLEENNFQIGEIKPIKLNLKTFTEGFSFKNPSSEIKNICGKIKRLIINGVKPGDIAVVAPNNQIMFQLSEEMKDMSIPHNISGTVKLSESKIVKMLLQPLKTIFSGYEIEDILALIESPYVPNRKLTMDQVEELFKEFGFLTIDLKPSLITEKNIEEIFLAPINEKIEKLSQIKEDDTYQERVDKIEEYKNFSEIIKTTFDLLISIEKNMKNDFFEWYKNFAKETINNISLFKNDQYLNDESIMKELNALFKFSEILTKLQKYKSVLFKNKKVSWETLYKILNNLLNVETYKTSLRYSNSVEIFDVSTARFVGKKYKFFVHFVDSYYPSFNINPLILQTKSNSRNFASYIEEIERRNTILSFIFTEKNFISYPTASLKGEPILPSQYMKEFCNSIKQEKEEDILPNPKNIYSIQDKEIFTALQKRGNLLKSSEKEWLRSFQISTLSHSKISSYVDCPFYFFLREIAKVKPISKDKTYLYKGILIHRILKEIFDKNLFSNSEEINVEEIKKLVEKEYNEIFRNEMAQYSLPKMIKIDEYSNLLSNFLFENLSEEGYLKIVGKFKLHRKKTKELETQYKTSLQFKDKDYEFEVRIDRIDELDKNYSNFIGKNSKEVQKNIIESQKKSLAIIDYKSSLKKIYAEQLLLYDLVYRKSIKAENFDTFLIFFNTSGDYPKNYFIKREDNKLILKGAGKSTSYFEVSYQFFLNWLVEIIEKISSGNFVPIALESDNNEIKPFLNYIKDLTAYSIKTTKEKKCINYNNSCDFADICQNFEIYSNVKLKK